MGLADYMARCANPGEPNPTSGDKVVHIQAGGGTHTGKYEFEGVPYMGTGQQDLDHPLEPLL